MLLPKDKKKIRVFRKRLFLWGKQHGRDFSWRQSPTPYKIFIAEFFLQRTKASQAEKQFCLFIKRYPTFFSLRQTSLPELQKYLRPLGLKKRIPAFRRIIKIINEEFGGQTPTEYNELISLPGIGDYTASAIEIFALNRRKALVDTNTIKIFSGLLGKKISRDKGKSSKLIKECAFYFSSLGRNFKKANWLLLDYGARFANERETKKDKLKEILNVKA